MLARAQQWRGSSQTDQNQSIQNISKQTHYKEEEDEKKFTHFISIPISLNNQDVQRNFINFRQTLLQDQSLEAASKNQLSRGNFTCTSMLHLTILQLNLASEKKINEAKAMMKDLEHEFQSNAMCKDDVAISFKGLKTS